MNKGKSFEKSPTLKEHRFKSTPEIENFYSTTLGL